MTASLLASHPAVAHTLGGVSDATRRPPALRPHGLRFAGRRLTGLKVTTAPAVGRSYTVLPEVVSFDTRSLSAGPDLIHGVWDLVRQGI